MAVLECEISIESVACTLNHQEDYFFFKDILKPPPSLTGINEGQGRQGIVRISSKLQALAGPDLRLR